MSYFQWCLLTLVVVGLSIPDLCRGGSFFTSFDRTRLESNGLAVLSCPAPGWKAGAPCSHVSVIRYDLGKTWPDNMLQHKLKLDLSRRQNGGAMTARDIPLSGRQKASIQFHAPDGITDHIDLGILGDNRPALQITGYFALIGNNHNRLGPGYRLAIEKATPSANWLFPGTYPAAGTSFSFNPKRMYRLTISSASNGEKVRLNAQVEEWIPLKGWRLAAKAEHTDHPACEPDTTGQPEGHCSPLEGKSAFFGAIFQDHPIYFDQFRVEW